MKHTPAPWQFIPQNHYGRSAVIQHTLDEPAYICDVNMPYHNDIEQKHEISKERLQEIIDEKNANAKLIAAAPELLEALKDCLRWMEKVNTCDEGDQAFQRATSAIKKATDDSL